MRLGLYQSVNLSDGSDIVVKVVNGRTVDGGVRFSVDCMTI